MIKLPMDFANLAFLLFALFVLLAHIPPSSHQISSFEKSNPEEEKKTLKILIDDSSKKTIILKSALA
jgi:hypothetical protein